MAWRVNLVQCSATGSVVAPLDQIGRNEMTIDERIEKLEAKLNRTRRMLACLAGGLFVGALVWAASEMASPARAENGGNGSMNAVRTGLLILQDKKGVVRAKLAMEKDNVVLRLNDAKGKLRTALKTHEHGGGLFLNDANGKLRAALGVTRDGASLIMADTSGEIRAELSQGIHDPSLRLAGKDGKLRARVQAGEYGAKIHLFDHKGKTKWYAPR